MIRKMLFKFMEWVWNYKRENEIYARQDSTVVSASDSEVSVEGLRFTVMPAIGGTLVQIRTYDNRKDRSEMSTYIITDNEDVATRVGQIVSLELLKT